MASISTEVSGQGSEVTIRIRGRFDFSVHREFRAAYEQYEGKDVRFDVDLAQTEYMDSSALGMLLMLREYAGGDSARVAIRNPSEKVAGILRIANFGNLFVISGGHAAVASV